jgi:hypothetical protein
MQELNMRKIPGWVALVFSTIITCFWALWGILENFHEGWFYDSILRNLGLMFVQYLSPMLIFMSLSLISIHRPRLGSTIHVILGLIILFLFRRPNTAVAFFIITPLVLLALLYWVGRPSPNKYIYSLVIGLPLLTLIICGIEPAIRVAGRIDDGNLGTRLVEGNGINLLWAPEGPAWPREGVSWDEAVRRCQFLNEDGKSLASTPQYIWRLPTAEEAVRSMHRHGIRCSGVWNPETAKALYEIKPDKESPLWNIHSQVIYWWTGTEIDEEKAYMIAYDGNVWPRKKQFRASNFAFRAVKNIPDVFSSQSNSHFCSLPVRLRA